MGQIHFKFKFENVSNRNINSCTNGRYNFNARIVKNAKNQKILVKLI